MLSGLVTSPGVVVHLSEKIAHPKRSNTNKASSLGEADSRSRGPQANSEGEEAALGAVDASVLATLLNLLDAESSGTAPAAAGRRWGQRQEEARRLACR